MWGCLKTYFEGKRGRRGWKIVAPGREASAQQGENNTKHYNTELLLRVSDAKVIGFSINNHESGYFFRYQNEM
jgi:hypothetical protein